ncbi:MAG TPA: hypothetical protein ENH85_13400 [Candidatus Scalindua sp.]|nr:hypothetical protein [Candidatus Scalindua sp.]
MTRVYDKRGYPPGESDRITKFTIDLKWLRSEKTRIEYDRGWKCEIKVRRKYSKFSALYVIERN